MNNAHLIELTNLLMESSGNPERWSGVIAKLAQLLGAPKGGLEITDMETGRAVIQAEYGLGPDFGTQYTQRFASENPFLMNREAFPPGRVVNPATIIPLKDLHKTNFYRKFLKPHGIEHVLCAVLFRESGLHGFLNLARPIKMRPFSAGEAALLQSIVPALQGAILVNRTLTRQAMEQKLYAELLDRLSRGIALLDGRGEVLHLNRNALSILEGGDGLMFEGKGIRAVAPDENLRFKRLMQATLSGSGGKGPAHPESCMLVTRTEADTPLSILFAPFQGGRPFPHESQTRMILFFSKLGQFSTNAKEVLKKLYGLTEAESRLAVMLLGGLSIEQSAQRLGITLNTARTHLKKLFLKTETNRQGELIRVMLESPATLYLD